MAGFDSPTRGWVSLPADIRVFGVVRGYSFERGGKAGRHCGIVKEMTGDWFWSYDYFIAEQGRCTQRRMAVAVPLRGHRFLVRSV